MHAEMMILICFGDISEKLANAILLLNPCTSLNGNIKCIIKYYFQIGTGVTNAIIKARKTVNKDDADEVETIPIVSTSIAYGVYMAVSSNLR